MVENLGVVLPNASTGYDGSSQFSSNTNGIQFTPVEGGYWWVTTGTTCYDATSTPYLNFYTRIVSGSPGTMKLGVSIYDSGKFVPSSDSRQTGRFTLSYLGCTSLANTSYIIVEYVFNTTTDWQAVSFDLRKFVDSTSLTRIQAIDFVEMNVTYTYQWANITFDSCPIATIPHLPLIIEFVWNTGVVEANEYNYCSGESAPAIWDNRDPTNPKVIGCEQAGLDFRPYGGPNLGYHCQ